MRGTFTPTADNKTLDSEIQVMSTHPGEDTYIYAINDAAKAALYIALNDTRIQQILGEAKGRAVTKAQAMFDSGYIGPYSNFSHMFEDESKFEYFHQLHLNMIGTRW